MEQNLIHEKAWQYKLYKAGTDYVLSVPCGSSAIYEVNVPISPDIAKAGLADPPLLEGLATAIKDDPESFISQSIKLN